MLNNVDLSRIEARFIEQMNRSFYLVWKFEPYPQSFICHCTPHSVAKYFNCTKIEAYKLIKAKLKTLERQIQREITEREKLISLIDKRLKFYKNEAYRDKIVTRICKKCGSVYQTTYNGSKKHCEKCSMRV